MPFLRGPCTHVLSERARWRGDASLLRSGISGDIGGSATCFRGALRLWLSLASIARGPGPGRRRLCPSWLGAGRRCGPPAGGPGSARAAPRGDPRQPPPAGMSHSYCSQMLSKEVDACVTELLKELVRFQDRTYQKDPVKAKTKRRLVLGLREVLKHLRLRKLKCVIISPNCEKIQSKGKARRAGSRSCHRGPCLPLTWPPGGRSPTQPGPGRSGWRFGRPVRPPGRWGAPAAPAVGLL